MDNALLISEESFKEILIENNTTESVIMFTHVLIALTEIGFALTTRSLQSEMSQEQGILTPKYCNRLHQS